MEVVHNHRVQSNESQFQYSGRPLGRPDEQTKLMADKLLSDLGMSPFSSLELILLVHQKQRFQDEC